MTDGTFTIIGDVSITDDSKIEIRSGDVTSIRLSDGHTYPMFVRTLQAMGKLGYIEWKETTE